jgi:5-methylthioadenosine/S-adenosylhomocysteine deaminase
LTPGKKADVIIIDPGTINFAPRFDWISQIIFNGQPTNGFRVFVNGQTLKARGKLVGVDPGAVEDAAQKAADRLRRDLGLD